MNRDNLRVLSVLSALGEQLDYLGGPPVELVVCGGSALQILGLVDRTTKDVDVLAMGRTGAVGIVELLPADLLPADLVSAAQTVARDFDLDEHWLNNKAAQAGQSLPEGLHERLHSLSYGKRLVIHAIDRIDQICLKLHAVVDQDPDSRHLVDLRALEPTEQELAKAAHWCLAQDAGEGFSAWFRSCLEKIGYANIAKSIEG